MSLAAARTLAEALEVGRQGEVVLDAAFGPEFIIVTANRHHQRQGIDVWRIDYKCGGGGDHRQPRPGARARRWRAISRAAFVAGHEVPSGAPSP
jgi:hypothetical protein